MECWKYMEYWNRHEVKTRIWGVGAVNALLSVLYNAEQQDINSQITLLLKYCIATCKWWYWGYTIRCTLYTLNFYTLYVPTMSYCLSPQQCHVVATNDWLGGFFKTAFQHWHAWDTASNTWWGNLWEIVFFGCFHCIVGSGIVNSINSIFTDSFTLGNLQNLV